MKLVLYLFLSLESPCGDSGHRFPRCDIVSGKERMLRRGTNSLQKEMASTRH